MIPDDTISYAPYLPAHQSVPAESRRGLWIVIGLLSMSLFVAAGGFAYSAHSAQSWRDTSGRTARDLNSTRQQREDFKAQLAATQVQLEATKGDLATVTTNYNQATDRIRSLANEKAQVGDQAAILAETVALSDRVTNELDTCVSDLQTFSSYLIQYQGQDMTNLLGFAGKVDTDCSLAKSDNAVLAQRLAQ
jgi:septal ring factor EnvC (AmiA/AmiB activator)